MYYLAYVQTQRAERIIQLRRQFITDNSTVQTRFYVQENKGLSLRAEARRRIREAQQLLEARGDNEGQEVILGHARAKAR